MFTTQCARVTYRCADMIALHQSVAVAAALLLDAITIDLYFVIFLILLFHFCWRVFFSFLFY